MIPEATVLRVTQDLMTSSAMLDFLEATHDPDTEWIPIEVYVAISRSALEAADEHFTTDWMREANEINERLAGQARDLRNGALEFLKACPVSPGSDMEGYRTLHPEIWDRYADAFAKFRAVLEETKWKQPKSPL